MNASTTKRLPRWGTRQEGMAHGRLGSTTMNELMQTGKVRAKKLGTKVLIDLNTIDDYINSLPDVKTAATAKEDA